MKHHEKHRIGDRSRRVEVTSRMTGRVASPREGGAVRSSPWRRPMKMRRLLGAASALALLSGCGGAVDSSSSDTSQALSSADTSTDANASSEDAAARKAEVEACLTTFAECVRNGSDAETCHSGLRSCMPPPPGRPHGDGDCDHDGPRPPDGEGDRPPSPPPDGEGDADGPRPPEGDGDRPPPPPCLGQLEECARGTDAIETCVTQASTCLPPPPPPR